MLIVGSLFLRQERMLPVTFAEEEYAFPYGPLAGGVGQTFTAPAPYLSQVAVTIDARGIATAGFPLNMRIRDGRSELVAEARLVVNHGGLSDQAISFGPIADSEGRAFEVEIQPAEGAEGDVYLPMRTGSGLSGEAFRDQEGKHSVDWSSNYRLHQTVRPLTFIRGIFTADSLTVLGMLTAISLLTFALAAASRGVGRVLGLKVNLTAGAFFSGALTLTLGWVAFATYPLV